MLTTANNIEANKANSTLRFYQHAVNVNYLIIAVVIFLVATANISFFSQVISIYPVADNLGFIFSITGLLIGLMWLVFQLLCYRPTAKVVLIAMVLIAAVCGYFTDSYGTIFDRDMLVNSLQTDKAEAIGLMAPSFLIRVLLLGVLPAFIISKIRLKRFTWRRSFAYKSAALLASLALVAACILPFGDQYASFFRQHKLVRSYTNPIMPIYSTIKLGTDYMDNLQRPDSIILHATDAKRLTTASNVSAKPKLMVFVVGETVRADHVGLNGYERDTMPLLAKRATEQADVYSFKNATSCGTSTAYSVPCMFSYANRDDYDVDTAEYNENVLDTLQKQGVKVIWRDNNSSSKGVADRVTFEDYKTDKLNPNCDVECRDIGMLAGFDSLIKKDKGVMTDTSSESKTKSQDTLIVLHQMGNHGPAYYQRYPKDFEIFKPVCMTNELSKCEKTSIINGYDNAIRYTDYFLNSVIDTLTPYQQDYDVVMIYSSDHGESLGENNIYLHGMPYNIAPESQKHIPIIIWSPKENAIDTNSLATKLNEPVSHDFITPTLLSFFGITTQEVANEASFFKVTNK